MDMKKATAFLLLFGIMCVLNSNPIQAQDATYYRIVTTDGNKFIGTLVSQDDAQVVLNTSDLGEVTIQRSNIKSMETIEPSRIKNGDYWYENPHATRYLFSTNAIGLKPGEGYYQNTWIFFNNVNVGVTKNISLGGGLVPTFLFGTSSVPVWLMPKVSIPIAQDNLHIAAGGLFGGIIGEDSFGLGLAYGVLTYGNTDKNITVGLGYGYGDGQWSKTPLININGMYRLTKTLYLVSENYFISVGDESTGIISLAGRWAPENFSIDFGLVRPTEDGEYIGLPWLGFTVPFGR